MIRSTRVEAVSCPLVVLFDQQRQQWLSFERPRQILIARQLEEVVAVLNQVEEAVSSPACYAAGFLAYEAAPAFDPALKVKAHGEFPLAWFGVYDQPVVAENLPPPSCSTLAPLNWRSSITAEEYRGGVERIRGLIRSGDTYQVNFTYRLFAPFSGSPWECFLELMGAQPPPYGAFIDTGDWAVCSASPELFFRLDGNRLESRPMKGTAARGLWTEADLAQAAQLEASAKERAENVMIVDMVRNDLGKVAEIGSVEVTGLFQVEQYPTVWQLTSTVAAQTRGRISEIFQALFPPASITGAPKPRTMELIAALESTPRRIYTGAIGFAGPDRRAQFNVAIRTLLIDKAKAQAEYGVGGGIVWDSEAEREAQECQVKRRVLRAPPPTYDLLESMLWTPEQGYWLLPGHLQRLAQSAAYFGFRVDMAQVAAHLERLAAGFRGVPCRVRLVLSRKGAIATTSSQVPAGGFAHPTLARAAVDASNPFLYHKTTHRQVYDEVLGYVPGAADVLLHNEAGEITESTIANVAIEEGGRLYTPPIRCGLLPGTYRAWLLEEKQLWEKPLSIAAVLASPSVYLFNSVRGRRQVKVLSR